MKYVKYILKLASVSIPGVTVVLGPSPEQNNQKQPVLWINVEVCYSLQTFITFFMMQTTAGPTLVGTAHHIVMRE